ncbi:hypothetical protein S7335_5368 [Synechococcus sp. PCC 7335]|uniref:hypothetical protein n=1 Tax=Synechococcus sp. (strain ATCC 29403 / PCC 7335) TaxID=91464 RepID=UPI00017EB180|nr:hypothetical protein [Synechococcus sp. PCC 7335]EDX87658.1 hypothetical protein S7335_5368 [Synechococcus sp. PCC 7335]
MVDRPIKKSDREAAQQTNPSDDQPKAARDIPKPIKKADRTDGGTSSKREDRDDRGRGGKGKGKGRGRGKDNAPRTPMNPALMRGPKPTKKVEEVVEAAAEETIPEDTATEETAAEETATEETAAEETIAQNTNVDTTEPEAMATNEV